MIQMGIRVPTVTPFIIAVKVEMRNIAKVMLLVMVKRIS